MFQLDATWSRLLESYKNDHRDPRNQFCHSIGIPMIVASIPCAATIVGIPLAAGLFTVGWGFQFAGHAFEGNSPAFLADRRALAVGVIWWLQKAGAPIQSSSVAV